MTQKQFRINFWQNLKDTNPELYKYGKRSQRQNKQITDIRLSFCDFLENAHRNNEITEKQAQYFTL
jgi:hypothetical protein